MNRGVHQLALLAVLLLVALPCAGQELPQLTAPVNDFANVIQPAAEGELDRMIRTLQTTTGDVVIVVTVDTVAPYADLRSYAVELFENRGKGIGERGKDNGLLVLLSLKERQVWVEVGYGLEEWITDGFAGETSREYMVPHFRRNDYGAGLVNGVGRIIGRIAEGRNVTLDGVQLPQERRPVVSGRGFPLPIVLLIIIVIMLMSGRMGGPRRGAGRWGRRRGWSGWSSGVGPFGGATWGGRGGFGGGGFGGGFGGFGGGRSGGGGGGAGW